MTEEGAPPDSGGSGDPDGGDGASAYGESDERTPAEPPDEPDRGDESPDDAPQDGPTAERRPAEGSEAVPQADDPGRPGAGDDGGSASEVGGAGQLQAAPPAVDEASGDEPADTAVPDDVRSYDRFQKVDRASYDRVNEFLRDRTYVTAREWAIARLCADFRTATGVEMTKIGEHLPELVPFMTDTYSPQAVNQARSAFEEKVRMAGATFLYGAMSGFFTADELDELMYEVTEVAKFLLEVEGVELTVEEELDAEDRISAVMREVRRASEELRYDEVACPHCGGAFRPDAED